MLIDHTGAILYPDLIILRIIGRLSFPIFCFLLVEGYCHTKNIKKYTKRLAIFALISEIPYDLAFRNQILEFSHQNVFFTLFIGLISLYLLNTLKSQYLRLTVLILSLLTAQLIQSDYKYAGVLMILIFYFFKEKILEKTVFVTTLNILLGGLQSYAALSMVPIFFYNQKKGASLKYFFYVFYPVHLLVLYFCRTF